LVGGVRIGRKIHNNIIVFDWEGLFLEGLEIVMIMMLLVSLMVVF